MPYDVLEPEGATYELLEPEKPSFWQTAKEIISALPEQAIKRKQEEEAKLNEIAGTVGKVLTTAGTAAKNVAAAKAFMMVGQPVLAAQQLGVKPETIEKLGGIPEPETGVSLIEQGMKQLPGALRVPSEAYYGMVETTPRLGAMAGLTMAGVPPPAAAAAAFGPTEQGFSVKEAAIAAALPFVGHYTGRIVESLARSLGVSRDAALNVWNKLGGATGAAGFLGLINEAEIRQLPAEQQDEARIKSLGGLLAQAALGMAGGRQARAEAPPPFKGEVLQIPEGAQPPPEGTIFLPKAEPVKRVISPEEQTRQTWEQEVVEAQRMAAHGTPAERALAMERLKVLRDAIPIVPREGRLPEGEAFPRSGVFETAEEKIAAKYGFPEPTPQPEPTRTEIPAAEPPQPAPELPATPGEKAIPQEPTRKISPTEEGKQIAKEPWQMTKGEWRRHEQRGTAYDFTDEKVTEARNEEAKARHALDGLNAKRKALGNMESIRKVMTDREGALNRNQARRDADKQIETARKDYNKWASRSVGRATHEGYVKRALEAGKPVPSEVLAEYPELKPGPSAQTAGEAPGPTIPLGSGIVPMGEVSPEVLKKLKATAAVGRKPVSGLEDIYRIFEPPPKKVIPKREKAINTIEWVRTGFSSKFRPINKLAEEIAKAYGHPTSKDIAGIMEQLKGSRGRGEAQVYRFDRDVASLVKGDEKDFNAYMFLNRSLDRLRQDQAQGTGRRAVAGYTIPVLEEKLALLQSKFTPQKVGTFQKAAAEYQRYMDDALRLQVQSQRMSPEIYEKIKSENQFYAPFKVMKWLEEGMRPEGTGRKIDTVADYTKAMEGIEDPNFRLGDMLAAGRQALLLSRILADKANAMRHVADLAKIDTEGKFITKSPTYPHYVPQGWAEVNVFENGKKVKYTVRESVAQAIQLYGDTGGGIVSRTLAAFSVPFKLGATALNIPFQVSNLMADVPRQVLVSRYGVRGVNDLVRYPLDFIHSLYSSMAGDVFGKPNKLFLDFLDSGAAGVTIQEYLTPTALQYRDPNLMSKAKRAALSILYTPAEFAAAIEQTSKIMGIKRAMRFEGVKSGMELAERIPEAVTEVRRFSGSPDFGRQGRFVEQARLNFLYMFLNARIQGAVADVGRLAGREGAKRAAITWFRLASAVGIPTAYLYYLNNSPQYKDDYAKRPQYEKDNYWLIPKDSFITTEDGEVLRDFWRIPKRESSKWIANATEYALAFAQKRDPQSFVNFGQQLIEDISPVNIQGTTAQERLESVGASLNPVIKAPIEMATGRDLYRHRQLVPETMRKASPEEQYTDRTAKAFVALGQAMPDIAPEVLRSPIMLESLARNLTAGLFTQFLTRKPVVGRTGAENIPLLQRFQAIPYTDNEAFMKEIRKLERESADEYLARHRAADKILEDNPKAPLPQLIGQAGKDPKLMQQVVDLWLAKKNGATAKDRQLIALPAKQRAQYLAKLFQTMTPEEKQLAILDLAKKRVLTESVFRELPGAIK